MQGDTLSSLITSNQEDTIGKKLLDETQTFYRYKGVIPIGVMAMVDDTVTTTETGHKTLTKNAFFNVKSAEKKLHFLHLNVT